MLLSKYKSPVVIQKFIEKVKYGDKRVILVNGKTVEKAQIGKVFLLNVLRENKLFFVGIDLIDQKLTEINVTSPTGIVQLRELYNVNVSKLIWEELMSIV